MSECTQKVAGCGAPPLARGGKSSVAGRGRLNHLAVGAAQGDPSVIPGMVRVNLIPSTILLKSGALHTFLSEEFDKLYGMSICVRVETR